MTQSPENLFTSIVSNPEAVGSLASYGVVNVRVDLAADDAETRYVADVQLNGDDRDHEVKRWCITMSREVRQRFCLNAEEFVTALALSKSRIVAEKAPHGE